MRHDNNSMYDLCKQHVHSYVLAETKDGKQVDGIITGLDEEYVYLAVPIDPSAEQHGGHDGLDRYGYPGYPAGYGGYGGYGGVGYPGPRPRFRRLVIPLIGLTALSLLPWY